MSEPRGTSTKTRTRSTGPADLTRQRSKAPVSDALSAPVTPVADDEIYQHVLADLGSYLDSPASIELLRAQDGYSKVKSELHALATG